MMIEAAPWPTKVLGELVEVLDHLRVPVNSEDRYARTGDVPYYGANGQQGWIDKPLFDEPLVLLAEDGGYFDEFSTRPIAYRIDGPSWVNNHAHVIRALSGVCQDYIFASLEHRDIRRFIAGGTRTKLTQKELRSIRIPVPPLPEQQQIAEILDTVDEAIRKTEQIIAKLKQMKQGLLHDLLTRGIDENGQLRPPTSEAPHLYQDSPLGKIPREWRVVRIDEVCHSAVDGPFGSNLKSSHYIDRHGVRVIRLQNIGVGNFDDSDRAYISEAHAKRLQRHDVLPGDLLVASLGDERHPFARACIYPEGFSPAITKADCFRLRLNPTEATNGFAAMVLNCDTTRQGVRRLAQGVTRDRVNLENLKAVPIPLPDINEQKESYQRILAIDTAIENEQLQMRELGNLKQGLMDDLLTGRVRVNVEEDAA